MNKPVKQEKYKVKVCPRCKGVGVEEHHPISGDDYIKPCLKCKGSGRILRKIIIKEIPYHPRDRWKVR